ncbi:MAG: hypothetical protein HZB43_11265 [candidate division Zixibacteria bacterium]|nr:hypothetical protein [candidate division Zixibacteria bacterium]
MKHAGIVLTALGGSAVFLVIYKIFEDMTTGFIRYGYGTTGHPEQMTAHEIGNLVFLAIAVAVTTLGIVQWRKEACPEKTVVPKWLVRPGAAGSIMVIGIGLFSLLVNTHFLPGIKHSWPALLVIPGVALFVGTRRGRK